MTDDIDARCRAAMECQLQGKSDAAERLYTSVLSEDPTHSTANYGLGMLKLQSKDAAGSVMFLAAALQADAQNRHYWLGLLEALLLSNQTDEAAATLEIARASGLAGIDVDEYAERLQRIRLPTSKRSRAERRRDDKNAAHEEEALAKLIAQHQFSAATLTAQQLTQRYPERGSGWKTLGALFWAQGKRDDAVLAMRTAARLLPQDAEAHSNLGMSLSQLNRFVEAESALSHALQIEPTHTAAHSHLGSLYLAQGRLQESESSFRHAGISLDNAEQAIADTRHSSLLFILSHKASLDGDALFAEHVRVGALLESSFRATWPVHSNLRTEDGPLNIGFVSGDFRNHAVANFIEPVLEHLLGFATLRLHAYFTHANEDAVSQRLKRLFSTWQAVASVSDNDLARKIMSDGIDILVDLSGHTSHNRLSVFARKPAPIQVSWIGYAGTTGLKAMDYYLADLHFLPPEPFAHRFTEKLVYLPANVPFRPYERAPDVSPLPALASGSLTFGSFNRLGKIDATILETWAKLLSCLPSSRLIVAGVEYRGQQDRLAQHLRVAGIGSERVEYRNRGSMGEYLEHHRDIDICLDTYPYTGGTTTIHALWMGVPTLTIAGSTPVSRQGAAILGQLGLHEFVASDSAEYVRKASYWAQHLPELADIRATLRGRWQASPARHPSIIAASLERAFLYMWARWRKQLPPESFVAPTAHEKNTGA